MTPIRSHLFELLPTRVISLLFVSKCEIGGHCINKMSMKSKQYVGQSKCSINVSCLNIYLKFQKPSHVISLDLHVMTLRSVKHLNASF